MIVPSHLPQATEEPVVPAEPMESMLRPFNLVIPFTVQKGELTGTALGFWSMSAQWGEIFQAHPLVLNEKRGPKRGDELPNSHSKLGRTRI